MYTANDIKDLREKTGAGMLDCKKALEESLGDMAKAIDWLREKGISKAAKKEARIAAEGTTAFLVEDHKAVIVEVNSETDFAAKNAEFKNLITDLTKTLINSTAQNLEEALELPMNGGTIKEAIIALTAKIGEKLSFRRFEIIEKTANQVFGTYSHMGGKISVLLLLNGQNDEIGKEIAMHVAAMNPLYIKSGDISEETLDHERKIIKEQAINEGKSEDIATKMIDGRINKYYKDVCLTEQIFVKDPDGKLSVGNYLKNNNAEVVKMIRYEVGEGIEKRIDDFANEVMNQING